MKRIFTLLLALVMTLSLAAPALAAEDVFEAPDAVEAAVPKAPISPIEEEAPVEEVPAEAPDMPQAAAAEPEDTEPAPDDAQTGKLTILGDTSKLWFVSVWEDYGSTDYQLDYSDIPIKPGDMLVLATDYRYTVRPDRDCTLYDGRSILAVAPFDEHLGDPANSITIFVEAADDGICDLTLTVEEDAETNIPALIPVNVTAPEGVTVETDSQVFAGTNEGILCEPGYVPFFGGAEPWDTSVAYNDLILTMFKVDDDAESVEVDVKKATGCLNITGLDDKVVVMEMGDTRTMYVADASNGLVGGMFLAVGVEADCSIRTDVEPLIDGHTEYEGVLLHAYGFEIPADGDFNMEIVKTPAPIDPPKDGTGWAYDETTGDYYYFVDGVQKSDYWAASQRGLWYYIGSDGRLARGFQYVKNLNGTGWYMFQTDNTNGCIGRMLTGWQWIGPYWGTGWFNTAHGGVNGQCTYTTEFGNYSAATGLWADGLSHQAAG